MAVLKAKVTSKGQITLPKDLRRCLSINTGDRLEFTVSDNNTISIRKQGKPGSSAGCARRFVESGITGVPLETMDEGIRRRILAKHGSGKKAKG